jgi:acetyl esterase/lipase
MGTIGGMTRRLVAGVAGVADVAGWRWAARLFTHQTRAPGTMTEVQVEKDLVFAAPDGSELAVDIYRAPPDDAPVTVYLHGGGWRGGDKADDSASRLASLSACGVTVVSVNYRLVPPGEVP